jgi:hypothetical protein
MAKKKKTHIQCDCHLHFFRNSLDILFGVLSNVIIGK